MIWLVTMLETTSRTSAGRTAFFDVTWINQATVFERREGREGIAKKERKKRERAVREQRSLERCYGYAPLCISSHKERSSQQTAGE